MEIARISPKAVRRHLASGHRLLLVCGYESDERFREMELEGAIPWSSFQAMLPSLAKDEEIVFYCA